MKLFAELSVQGSLTATGAVLGLSKQSISRRLLDLEQALGVELVRRTTRRIVFTDVGRAYALRCGEMMRLVDDANRGAASAPTAAEGTLRVTADNTFGEAFLPELVVAYLLKHPDVCVEVVLTSRRVDLIEERVDVAFRIGPPPDLTYVAATRLGPAHLWTVATSDYLANAGVPLTLDDLLEHECLVVLPSRAQRDPGASSWPFMCEGILQRQDVPARLSVNGVTMARHAVLAGAGIAHLPEFAVADDVACGRLTRVLRDHTPEVGGVHAVYPHSHLLAPRVTTFLALAESWFGARSSLV